MFRPHLRHHMRRWACRLLASQAETLGKYAVGLRMHGFITENVQPIPEFSLVAVQLKHVKTGLQHLHLDSPGDKNNVFSVALKTNPPNRSGVPHILEHTTLCGSYKYPVRDPFFKMLNRSLSNFMNAMTGHDYTFYPFATTNRRDYDNLMDVYLSSVFEPLLTYEDFLQEGWRLEQSDMTDKKSDLTFKGVVYNEMKGQYSNSNYLYWIQYQEAVYPSLKNSGGDPAKITDLHYEDLVDFHAQNYHPSNARTYSYGSFPLTEHLQKLDEFYGPFGSRSAKREVKKSIFETNPETKLYNVEVTGPVDPMASKPAEEQYKSLVTWYLGNPLEEGRQYEIFKWKALNSLLCDGHSSPFYQELIETGYGEDFSPNSGLDQTTALLAFTIGLTNLSEAKTRELGNKITSILKEKVIPEFAKGKESVFHERIDAILHQLELGFKKHRPEFGLGLLNSIVPTWVNGVDPVKSLHVETILNQFKHDYEENGLAIFEEMLRPLLDDSTPRFHFTMKPETDYNEKLVLEESERLKKKVENLTEEDKEAIYKRNQVLLEKQQQPADVSVLPTLTMEDIPRRGDFYDLSFTKLALEGQIQKRIVDTNDLVYLTATKDLSFIPERLYKYLPLFNTCLTNLAGTDLTSITELENKIQQRTGGISFSINTKTDPYNIGNTLVKFIMSGMALSENSNNIYDLWLEILTRTKFTDEDAVVDKLNTLVRNLAQNQLNLISDRGHSYANAFGNAQLTPTKKISDILGGIEQVKLVLELNKRLDDQGRDYLKSEVLPILQEIQQLITRGSTEGTFGGFNYSIVADKNGVKANESLIEKFDSQISGELQKHPNQLSSLVTGFVPGKPNKTILNFPFQVGYASLAKLGSSYTSKDGASLQVLSQIMTYKHLHSVIRESNGAYGGGLNYDGLGGTLNFYSYRDPNAIKSAAAFSDAFSTAQKNLADGKWDAKDLQEAKLAIFQSVDAPSHILSQGSAFFLEGISDEMRQERRERFLDVSLQDLQEVNEKYLGTNVQDIYTVIGDAGALGADEEWQVKQI